MMNEDPSDIPLDAIDPDIRDEIGDPVPMAFAATVVYVPLLVVGFLASFFTRTLPGARTAPDELLTDLALGAGVGLAFVALSRIASLIFASVRELDRRFHEVLEPLTPAEVIRIALLSAFSEELIFRGTLQPLVGYPITSVLFALVHFVPGSRVFLPWTLFALGGGFLFGGLALWRDSLVAPIVAHTIYNVLNIYLLRRQGAGPSSAASPIPG